MLKKFSIKTVDNKELINITSKVSEIVQNSKVKDGICIVFTLHTTSAILINEDEPGLKKDIVSTLEKLIPEQKFLHNVFDNNAKSHIISSIIGESKTIIIENGKLKLGKWQNIFLAEFDGPREDRKILVQIIADNPDPTEGQADNR